MPRPTLPFFLALACMILLNGCQTTRKALDLETKAELKFNVAAYVNPDSDNRTSPLNVTVVQLRDHRQFEQEDFIALYQDTAARLSGDFITQTPLHEFLPGEERTESFNLTEEVKYLGLIAAFANYEQAKTRVVLEIKPHQTNAYLINIEGLNLSAKAN